MMDVTERSFENTPAAEPGFRGGRERSVVLRR